LQDKGKRASQTCIKASASFVRCCLKLSRCVMNKKDFKKSARKLHIPNFLYNIDGIGRDDERFCLVQIGKKMECVLLRTWKKDN